MQFEEFDNKIKEAADHHHPAYDEQAWAKMHKLLDKHLPEKEKKRRRFIWFFFAGFILAGSGIFYTVNSLITKENKPVAAAVKRPEKRTIPVNPVDVESKTRPVDAAVAEQAAAVLQQETSVNVKQLSAVSSNRSINGREQMMRSPLDLPVAGSGYKHKSGRGSNGTGNTQPINSIKKKKKNALQQPAVPDAAISLGAENVLPDQHIVKAESRNDDPQQPGIGAKPDNIAADSINAGVANTVKTSSGTDSITDAKNVTATKNNKAGVKKKSRFYLTLSAGPDASFAASGKPGRIIPVTGAGIGYTYKERFSIRTGFYNANKVYSATPDAYNPPASFYNYYPYLQKVDASCRVYEIPVSLGYHFGSPKKQNWFVSASVSSYIMKRETYDYTYKTSAWGPVQNREYTFRNRNEHLFSVVGLSGGYQRRISDRITLIAEPYLRMPVSGVGYGRVKLNSAGVLFSVTIQPAAFIPRKK